MGNAQWQRQPMICHMKIGDILLRQRDSTGAMQSFRKGPSIAEVLAESDPANPPWQRDLAVGYFKIGDVLVEQGDKASALQEFRKGLPGARDRKSVV